MAARERAIYGPADFNLLLLGAKRFSRAARERSAFQSWNANETDLFDVCLYARIKCNCCCLLFVHASRVDFRAWRKLIYFMERVCMCRRKSHSRTKTNTTKNRSHQIKSYVIYCTTRASLCPDERFYFEYKKCNIRIKSSKWCRVLLLMLCITSINFGSLQENDYALFIIERWILRIFFFRRQTQSNYTQTGK